MGRARSASFEATRASLPAWSASVAALRAVVRAQKVPGVAILRGVYLRGKSEAPAERLGAEDNGNIQVPTSYGT